MLQWYRNHFHWQSLCLCVCSCCHSWCSHLHFGYHWCQPCNMKGLHASWYMRQCFHLPHPCPGQCSLTHHTHCQYLRLWLFTSVPCTFHLISLYLFSMSLTFWTRVPISYGLHRFEDALYLIIFVTVSTHAGTTKWPVRHCLWPVDVPGN